MDFTRRKLLKYSSVGLLTALAGCGDQGEVSNPTSEPTDTATLQPTKTATETATETPTETATETSTPTSTPQESVVSLGESLVYTEGDQELEFTIYDASLHDLLVTSRSGSIFTSAPENPENTYLTVLVDVTNTGDTRITTPSSIVLTMNGRQYEPSFEGYRKGRYESYNELLPGSTTSGSLVFAIPPADAEGRIVVDFARYGEAVTGEWVFKTGDLPHETYDYQGRDSGDLIDFGTESTKYQLGAVDYEETRSYTYSSSGYNYRETAAEGKKFVHVSVYGKNSGDTKVSLPGTYSMSLLTGSSQYDASFYSGSDGYEGGEIAPGVERRGIVEFEVPQSASDYELQVDLTSDLTASWDL